MKSIFSNTPSAHRLAQEGDKDYVNRNFMERQDDIGELLKNMRCSQVWIHGTQTYWLGPTAQFKAFIERWYNSYQLNFTRQCAFLIIHLGERTAHFPRHIIGIFRDILNYLVLELMVIVLYLDSYSRDAVDNN